MLTVSRITSLVVAVAFILVALVLGGYVRGELATQIVQADAERTANVLMQNFSNTVWKKYSKVFAYLEKKPLDNWYGDQWYQRFQKEMDAYYTSLPFERLVLHSIKEKREGIIWDNERIKIKGGDSMWDVLVSHDLSQAQAITKAKQNQIVGRIKASLEYDKQGMPPQAGAFAHIFVPITVKTDKGVEVKAVAEVYLDVTEQWDYLLYIQIVLSLSLILALLVVLVIIVLTSAKAEKIIAKQHEMNVELSEAKARAESESQEKSKFLANVSHELRTPLNAIIGFSEILKDEVHGPIGDEQYKGYINDIHSSGSHLLSLINDILDYSKAEAEKLQVDTIDVDVTKMVKNSLRLVQPRAEEAKVELRHDVPSQHLVILADPKRLKQVFLNLLSNAVKFTPEGGSVTLLVYVQDGRIFMEVRDTGIGIAAKDISKAMSTFGQVDSKLSRRYEGTGLGLPLTKKLVGLMGGDFDIKSEEGFGTTVILSFVYDEEKNASYQQG